ncbi:hypothetical protein [Amycolatopsis sp. MtRt-6]|uniref:hypothetical protein n=1 Tax=Amycolatopsis sp. MtRt-6 TaxID=2792782 RepID=UPI001A8C1B49|nr:hypothetical protein [Amycolatopsis sp. MtRt-6]
MTRGLPAEPRSEILYRDLLRIEYRAGNHAGVRETAGKLIALVASLDVELDDETGVLASALPARRPQNGWGVDQLFDFAFVLSGRSWCRAHVL